VSSIILIEEKTVRRAWDAENQKWLFAIVDVLGILTESTNPAVYWRVLKKRLRAEGNQTVTNCNAFKMASADGNRDSAGAFFFPLLPTFFFHFPPLGTPTPPSAAQAICTPPFP
jgi:hypothetical protein